VEGVSWDLLRSRAEVMHRFVPREQGVLGFSGGVRSLGLRFFLNRVRLRLVGEFKGCVGDRWELATGQFFEV
jgi:hypothetical protein